MPGAIKPPWISRETFYKLPFNFCDRWCERCRLAKICRVYLEEQKSKEKYLGQGKDPDSLECAFATVKDNFAKVRKMLKRDTKKFGIDLNNINTSSYQEDPEPNKFPLYKLVDEFSKLLETFVNDLTVIPEDGDEELIEENIKIISYYRLLIPAKTYRAILSRLEEEQMKDDTIFDSRTSALILTNSLMSVSNALVNLAKHKPLNLTKSKSLKLAKVSLVLTQTIREEFQI